MDGSPSGSPQPRSRGKASPHPCRRPSFQTRVRRMARCPKCNHTNIKKGKDGKRRCPHCGPLSDKR